MNYNEFLKKVEKEMDRLIGPTRSISMRKVTKNNNTIYDALIVYDPLINISPAIYLNPYYHRLLDGVEIDDIIADIYATYQHFMPDCNVNMDFFTDYGKCSSKIIMKLISYDHNQEMLADVPYYRWMDMALIFQCMVPGPDGSMGTITIHNDHFDLLHVDREQLLENALANTPALLPAYFANLRSCIRDLNSALTISNIPLLPSEKNMYILSNTSKVNGAAAIFYPHMMGKIADILDGSYFILPSSVNELLIIPCEDEKEYAEELSLLTTLVHDVNETEVSDEEFLSDQAYYYNRNTEEVISNEEANGRAADLKKVNTLNNSPGVPVDTTNLSQEDSVPSDPNVKSSSSGSQGVPDKSADEK